MSENSEMEKSLVRAYLSLRMAVGYVGFFLPVVLAMGALIIFKTGLQNSISDYYHTDMGDVFVGSLCVIGVFLLSYRRYKADRLAGYLGSAFAIGTALFPPARDGTISATVDFVGVLHLASAAALFLTLIYFALFLFTKTNPDRERTPKKQQRDKIYRACGYLMTVCMLLMLIYALLPDDVAARFRAGNTLFWLETVLVMAFGFAWLTKGGALLEDVAEQGVA